ncbi:YgfZ/GcvT domain-containing protein [Tabrizicola sp.]|uniref:CAF17-like 4Fe-4S cluster assembly/insertion protein YgfZ n=1 Tax=Tabrizicola sp. TaxID=2005166 RepID=UPI003D266D8D
MSTTTGETAPDRRIYQIIGADALSFLQGMTSNDVLPLAKAPGIVWTALLTPQGKYLADFFVVNTGEVLLLDIKDSIADSTLRRLSMYKLRSDVAFGPSDLSVTRGLGPAPQGALEDPRHPALGWRAYGAAGTAPQIDWDALRVTHLIPETGVELIPDDSYLLEHGFERLNGVNFRKGCYVGQEVTARMKHKTELRKGLVQVAITGAAPIGTEVRAGEKLVGRLFTQSGGRALAYLRLDQAQGEMTAQDATLRLV